MNKVNNNISICGIGPGNPDYITKVVWDEAKKADILIGGKRQLDIFSKLNKEHIIFNGKTECLKQNIEKLPNKRLAVMVSGDTGFYSLRRFLISEFPLTNIQIFPGISTFQYFYAQLGKGYENAFLASLHGTDTNFIDELERSSSVFLLTDKKNNYKKIASKLVIEGFENALMHIGANLSYPNEIIVSNKAKNIIHLNDEFELCSVIIEKTAT